MSHEELSIKIKAKQATESSWAAINKLLNGVKVNQQNWKLIVIGTIIKNFIFNMEYD